MAKRLGTRNRKGITLIELLVASSLFAVAITAFMFQSNIATQTAIRGQLDSEASLRCHAELSKVSIRMNSGPQANSFPIVRDGLWETHIQVSKVDLPHLAEINVITFYLPDPSQGRCELTRLVYINSTGS